MGRKIVLGLVTVAGVAGCVFLVAVVIGQGLVRASLWAAVLAAAAAIVTVGVTVWALPVPPKVLVPPELELPGWVVDRPVELDGVVKALVSGHARTVGITTGLYGAGGFGKTTLAQMACANRRVRRRFGGRVYLVTVGRDVRGAAAVSAKVNDVIKLVSGKDATFTDPQLAGQHLGSLLSAGPRRLLVVDDVWEPEQLAPFAVGGHRCARLVTTRVPRLLAGRSTVVQVDQMSPEQARALLTYELPPLDPKVTELLLAVTGRWPLLLRLTNKILADAVGTADVSAQGVLLLERLRKDGPAAIDDLRADARRGLDVGQPQQRAKAVRATIEASTSLLEDRDKVRFEELGVFAEDEVIPFRLVVQLWRATAQLDELQAAQVVSRLAQLALVSLASGPARGITVHDVVRDFLRAELGEQQLAELNGTLLDSLAATLPHASPLTSDGSPSCLVGWWSLDDGDRYLWDHLIEHLIDAGRPGEAEVVAGDLRWVGARIERFGPAAPAADLSAVGTPRAARLRAVLARSAHLLAPTEPRRAVVDVLHSRMATDPDWGLQVSDLRDLCPRPRLVNRWPLPDLADPALLRVLTHTSAVTSVAVAPDGTWLASGSEDGSVRIWDVATGTERASLAGHIRGVNAVAVAPDGTWLASGGDDWRVRIWDVATGTERASLAGHTRGVNAVAVASDGTWLASGGDDGRVRIWDVANGKKGADLAGHTGRVRAVAVAPDGTWLASGNSDGRVRIWDIATATQQVWIWHIATATKRASLDASSNIDVNPMAAADGRLAGYLARRTRGVYAVAVAPDGSWLATSSDDGGVRIWDIATATKPEGRDPLSTDRVNAMVVAPDGSWLATGSDDQTVRIWDIATGNLRASLAGHSGEVKAVAVAPDGTWLATGSDDQTVRIWDIATATERASLAGHTGLVKAVAVAPDGSWLASTSGDQRVRIWDVATATERASLAHTDAVWPGVGAVAVAPDGSWLATGSDDGSVRIWDPATATERASLAGHTSAVWSVAVAPDGSWLATSSYDGNVRIWDLATATERASLAGHTYGIWKVAMAVAPDGSWLATGSDDGSVRIWDLATATERASLAGDTSAVWSVAVAPDGSWLATGSDDGSVRIWDLATATERASLAGHTGPVRAVAVAPDGSWLATSSDDGSVRIWDPATERTRALMRVEKSLENLAWLNDSTLVSGGPGGLYLFDLLDSKRPNHEA